MKWACLLALACAISINYEQAEASGTIEVYFVFDDAALKQFLKWGARSMRDAKKMAGDELDYILTELNLHYESLRGLGLKMGIRDVEYLNRDVFNARYGQISPKDALDGFKQYLNREKAQDKLKYDMAILFTGYDLGSRSGNGTAGYADVGAVCRKGHGAGVVEFGGTYSTVSIAAHEMGHIMGSNHDGAGDGHIMSPATVNDSPYRWMFSSFSRGQISAKIQELDRAGTNCLKKTNPATKFPNVGIPDSLSTPDQICQRRWGPEAFMCRFKETSGDDLCYQFLCDTKDPKGMCWSALSSDGMACGKGKACRKGKCVRDSKISNNIDDKCPFGDMKKVSVGNGRYMECGEFINSGKGSCDWGQTKAQCCKTCGDLNTGDPNCPYGDKKQINFNKKMQTCGAVISKFTGICSRSFMQKNCCASCKPGATTKRPNNNNNNGDCKDKNSSCVSWARRNECQRNPTYMLKNCKKSCGKCGGGNTNSNCKDNESRCPSWASSGECRRNPTWMLVNCKKSCKQC